MVTLDLMFQTAVLLHPISGDDKLIIAPRGMSYEKWEALLKLVMILRIVGTMSKSAEERYRETFTFLMQDLNPTERQTIFQNFQDAQKFVKDFSIINYDGEMSFSDLWGFTAGHKLIK